MTPQYQFNLGQADPLLSIAQNNPEGYISVIEQELQKLNNVKQQLIQAKMKILVVLKLGITLKQLIEFILDLLLRQYVFLNMLPFLLFIYLIQKIYYFSLFFFK